MRGRVQTEYTEDVESGPENECREDEHGQGATKLDTDRTRHDIVDTSHAHAPIADDGPKVDGRQCDGKACQQHRQKRLDEALFRKRKVGNGGVTT